MKIDNSLRRKVCGNCGEINDATVTSCVTCRGDLSTVRPTVPEEILLAEVERRVRTNGNGAPPRLPLSDDEVERIATANRQMLMDEPVVVLVDGFTADGGNNLQAAARRGASEALNHPALRVRMHDDSLAAILTPMGTGMTNLQNGINTDLQAINERIDEGNKGSKTPILLGALTLFGVLALIVIFFALRTPVSAQSAVPAAAPATPVASAPVSLTRGQCIAHCMDQQVAAGFEAGKAWGECNATPECQTLTN